jgi:hypothetical protein
MALIGVAFVLASLLAAGSFGTMLRGGAPWSGLGHVWLVGMAPLVGAAIAAAYACRHRPRGVVFCVTAASAIFTGGLACWCGTAVEVGKSPRQLVQSARLRQTERDIRMGCYRYFQPSLVFCCHREVFRLDTESQALDFLRYPLQSYLFLPASSWEALKTNVHGAPQVIGRHWDMYQNCEVLVVANR